MAAELFAINLSLHIGRFRLRRKSPQPARIGRKHWSRYLQNHLQIVPGIQRYLADKKQPPPMDHHRALGIFLLQGPRGALFLTREVPL